MTAVRTGLTSAWGRRAAAECVTTTDHEAHYMGLPAPRICERPRAHWVIPQDGTLSPSSAVRAFITAGADIDIEEAES
ncbi:hypothetical protein AB0I49_11985 [Streptomyces sp. NPDC050617]|uniref:hypothetical protein n=1 Tax=Streptomyces sp. NPDC050617 TaxID=3154628 RepID=UPI003432172C